MTFTHVIEIVPADALTFAPEWARGFQAHISDPPYSARVHANITSAGTMGEGSRGWHRQDLEFPPLSPELRDHMAAVSARVQGWSLIYSDHESSHEWRAALDNARAEYVRSVLAMQDGGAESDVDESGYSGVLPWERWSQPQKSGDRPTQGFEVVTLSWGRRSSRKTWNGPGSLTSLRHAAMRGADKHRTQKPLDQALDLVSFFTNAPHLPWGTHHAFVAAPTEPGGECTETHVVPAASVGGRLMTAVPAQSAVLPVLDLTAGSGTTALACFLLGRSCVAYEFLPKWSDYAARRLEEAQAGRLDAADVAAVEKWVKASHERDDGKPEPKAADGSDVKTWERLERRRADVRYLEALL